MLSQTAEYALRAIVCLAQHPGRPMVTGQIAKLTKVPPGYLSKVLQSLAKAGLVQSHRGIHGGFVLAAAGAGMSILDVLNVVDPVKRIRTCPLGLEAHGKKLCALHRRLDEAVALAERGFAETTIADLLAEPSPSQPLCDIMEEVLAPAPAPAAAARRPALVQAPRVTAQGHAFPRVASTLPLRRSVPPVDDEEENAFARPLRRTHRRLGEIGA